VNIKTALSLAGVLALTGCTAVTVQVPPEVDLQAQGIRSVVVEVTDLPNDPAPLSTLLRGEATSQIQQVLPALTVVDDPQAADAVLLMEVANHGVGPALFENHTNSQGTRVACDAWQEAFLLVNASVYAQGKPSPSWHGWVEKRTRIDLSCNPIFGPLGAIGSPAVSDPQLVYSIVREIGMRLAGYTRKEYHLGHHQP
jgi:hypothetical protein